LNAVNALGCIALTDATDTGGCANTSSICAHLRLDSYSSAIKSCLSSNGF
jgi:hypothetical protein